MSEINFVIDLLQKEDLSNPHKHSMVSFKPIEKTVLSFDKPPKENEFSTGFLRTNSLKSKVKIMKALFIKEHKLYTFTVKYNDIIEIYVSTSVEEFRD